MLLHDARIAKAIRYLPMIFCAFCALPGFGQAYLFNLEHFGLEYGFPTRVAYSVAEDQQGYIWVSSQMGIHRFNGQRFKTWSTERLGLPSRRSTFLAVDEHNRIWLSGPETDQSHLLCSILDPEADTVLSPASVTGGHLNEKDIVGMEAAYDGRLGAFVLTHDGSLYRYTDRLQKVADFGKEFPWKGELFPGNAGEYFFIHRGTINYLSPTGELDSIRTEVPGNALLRANRYVDGTYYKYSSNATDRYICKWEHRGLKVIEHTKKDPETLKILLVKTPDYSIYSTKTSIDVRSNDGELLESFHVFPKNSNPAYSTVYEVLHDRKGNIWIASTEGLFKISVRKNPFQVLFPQKSIYGIMRVGPWLISTANEDSTLFNIETQETVPPPRIQNAKGVFQDSEGLVWIMHRRGYLSFFNPATREVWSRLIGIDLFPNQVFEDDVTKVIMLGTRSGLFRLVLEEEDVHLFPIPLGNSGPGLRIRAFSSTREGVWVASSQGLFLVDHAGEKSLRQVSKEEGLPGSDINHFMIDEEGHFWIATVGAGLIHWNVDTDQFEQFTVETGLSNNTIYAVYEDKSGKLWLPSDYGLMTFDKERREVLRVYHTEDGIAHEEFNTFSHFRDASGRLYFGGLGGITTFHPEDSAFTSKQKESPLLLTSVKVVKDGENQYTDRTEAYRQQKKIVLAPDDQIVDIEISYLDFEQVKHNQIAYRLQGYQESWVYPNDMRVFLMHLPYGEHTIQVRARGASGDWSRSVLRIPIEVLRPFYLRTWFWLLCAVLLIAAIATGVRLRLRALRRDRLRLVREVRKRTQTISAQAEELKSLERAKSRFFANITHEIRTPLTLVIGPAEKLLKEEQPAPTRRGLKSILKNSKSLLKLINQLLDIAKMENARMQVLYTREEIVRHTAEWVDQFELVAEQKQIRIQFRSGIEKWEIPFDFEKWGRVLDNLLSNAIKYTPAGGRIELSLDRIEADKAMQIELKVTDSGIGISEEHLEHVFDRFYQVEDEYSVSAGGTGIGLALVKELVELQSGSISVQSKRGKGTTFAVRIPVPDASITDQFPAIQREHAASLDPDAEEQPIPELPIQENRLRLLLIEDHADLRAFIRSCIDEARYEVHEAENGAVGIKMAQKIVPDLIISDVMMPEKDGFEVTRAIRANIVTSHIPLILLTAKTSQDSRMEGLRRGADAYLTKPFDPDELQLRIDKLLELRQLLRDRYRPPGSLSEVEKNRKELPVNLQGEDGFIVDLKAFIEAHMNDPELKVSMITRHFGMSRPQLYRKLSAITDSGISDLIRSARCEKALEMIKAGNMRMSEIAYAVGYSSPGHFSRSFKQQFGVAPSQVLPNGNGINR